MTEDPIHLLTHPARTYSRADVLARPSPVPATGGIYGWYFRRSPHPAIDLARCVTFDEMWLMYVGIAPKAAPAVGTPSTQTLRSRIRYHFRGHAEGSTLRLTLGCLLAESLGIALRRVGSGTRLTFTHRGEQVLSDWMAENAFVTWAETADPWLWEDRALQTLDLPLNLRGNAAHRFHGELTAARAVAKAQARALEIFT